MEFGEWRFGIDDATVSFVLVSALEALNAASHSTTPNTGRYAAAGSRLVSLGIFGCRNC